jgi:hypothetical protein
MADVDRLVDALRTIVSLPAPVRYTHDAATGNHRPLRTAAA